MKIGAIIQARVSSTRFREKLLKELPYGSGITVLHQVIKRVKKSNMIDCVYVARSTKKEDQKTCPTTSYRIKKVKKLLNKPITKS